VDDLEAQPLLGEVEVLQPVAVKVRHECFHVILLHSDPEEWEIQQLK